MLKQELSRKILDYIEGNENRNINSLAHKSGVAYTTVRQMAMGEYEKPNMSAVLSVLNVIDDANGIKEFAKKYYPSLAKIMTSSLESNDLAKDNLLDTLSGNQNELLILAMAGKVSGTCEEEIKDQFGKVGIHSLNRLLNAGVLREINGRIKPKHEGESFTTVDLKKVHHQLTHLLASMDIDDWENNFVSLNTNGFNHEGHVAVANILRKSFKEISELGSDSRYHGDRNLFAGMFLGRIEKGSDHA